MMLEDASIKLSSVASSLNTVSARAMLGAMIDGETDPLKLAELARGPMRRKIPDLAQALTGTFDADHAPVGEVDAAAVAAGRAGPGRTRRGDRRRLPAVAAPDRAAADHSRGRGEGRAGDRRRDRRGHVAVPDRGASGRVGRVGAGDERVRRTADSGREAAREQVAGRDAGRGGRLGRPDACRRTTWPPSTPG